MQDIYDREQLEWLLDQRQNYGRSFSAKTMEKIDRTLKVHTDRLLNFANARKQSA